MLDPIFDRRWRGHIARDKSEFLELAENERSCALFIDESGESIGRYNEEMVWLATRARHYGHNSHFICQRASMLNRTVREQCELLCLFRVSEKDAKMMAEDWAQPALMEAANLNKGEFIYAPRFGDAKRLNAFGARLRAVA